jgi:hypothetical protein
VPKRNSTRPRCKPVCAEARTAITYLPPDALLVAPMNPRLHSREQIRAIARSIEAFGFNAPIPAQDQESFVVRSNIAFGRRGVEAPIIDSVQNTTKVLSAVKDNCQ